MAENLEQLTETLAAIEHERWAHWQRYLHDQAVRQPDGSLVLPAALVARWQRQISTEYANLPEHEKEGDREQVRKYLPLIWALVEDIASADHDENAGDR